MPRKIQITNWALDSYLALKGTAFDDHDYRNRLRPDVELLRDWPHDPRFKVSSFWGPAEDMRNKRIEGGYKMKWHNLGPGRSELRLCVAIVQRWPDEVFLCHAYTKDSAHKDSRELATLKNKIQLIEAGRVRIRGSL
jgi:hypothetical protein